MRNGGSITAWSKDTEWLKASQTFSRIESIPLTVVYASSQESGEGDANHLTDGNPNSYWHTMYSVTVANYPHWVDFDCGGVKTIKGFTYLPRQNSGNGNIKKYSIQVTTEKLGERLLPMANLKIIEERSLLCLQRRLGLVMLGLLP